MGADQDAIQGTVVFRIAVISTLLNGAFDALVCLVIHVLFLLLIGFWISMSMAVKEIRENFSFPCISCVCVVL